MNHGRDHWNRSRHNPGDAAGHHESYFVRTSHPSRPLAFWIRYTVFSPLLVEEAGRPPRKLLASHRAAFEVLTDRPHHGVRVVV